MIKELMKKVDEEYGLGDTGDSKDGGDDEDNEVLAANPLDAFAEDAIWQEDQIDSFLNQNQEDQNLKIARNLLATTALTRHEIAEITGVDADLLADYESDYSTEEEEESEEEEPLQVDKILDEEDKGDKGGKDEDKGDKGDEDKG